MWNWKLVQTVDEAKRFVQVFELFQPNYKGVLDANVIYIRSIHHACGHYYWLAVEDETGAEVATCVRFGVKPFDVPVIQMLGVTGASGTDAISALHVQMKTIVSDLSSTSGKAIDTYDVAEVTSESACWAIADSIAALPGQAEKQSEKQGVRLFTFDMKAAYGDTPSKS